MNDQELVVNYQPFPGDVPGEGYIPVTTRASKEPPSTSDHWKYEKLTQVTEDDKEQIQTNKENITTLQGEVSDLETEVAEKSEVSGENDGTNWTKITIDGVEKNIPTGGGGGGFTPTQAQLDAMNSGIDSTKVSQIETNKDDIASLQTEVDNLDTDKQDVLTPGDGIVITGTNIEANVGAGLKLDTQQGSSNKSIQVKVDNDTIKVNANGELYADVEGADAYTKSETDALLNNKVDKVSGKGLSTNDYTNADKTKLDGIDMSTKQDVLSTAQLNAVNSGIDSTKVAQIATNTTNISNKVDKETGKGLSTNDYTTAEKNKVALINSTETLTFTLSGGTTVNLKVVTGV